MDINLSNYKESTLNYKLFKEFYNDYNVYKKKYKDYILKKREDINQDKFKNDTKNLMINLYIYIDFLDDIYLINKKIITYITKINIFLDEFNRKELCRYLKKIFISIEITIFPINKNRDEIEFKLETLIYIRDTTKYLDIVKKNFELYQHNYNLLKKERNFIGIINEIRLLTKNYKCIYEKYINLCDYFSNVDKNIFFEIDPLIKKHKQSFILLLEDHTTILKKYC